jgi:hypothetical protein
MVIADVITMRRQIKMGITFLLVYLLQPAQKIQMIIKENA